MRGGSRRSRRRSGHGEGGEGAPGRRDGLRLGDQTEVDLDLPALVHLGSAAVSTRGPGAVRYSNQVGAETVVIC